ncbi:MAG: YjzC family protein, partial [Candidatus Angelobacter sp.]|nr:YjzC family protein [Candidatus Angelobacter sp.]
MQLRIATIAGDHPGGEVKAFRPGQYVPKTGVYTVHHKSHRLMHHVAFLADERFPSCRQCDNGVRFELHQATTGDGDFPFRSGAILKDYVASLAK